MSQQYPLGNGNQQWNNTQPPYNQAPFPPSSPKKQKSPREIWRQAGKAGKCGIISVCFVLVLSMCICAGVVNAGRSGSTVTSKPQATLVTPTVHSVVILKPTPLPTLVPTPLPTPVPTPKPTDVPTALPTQAPVPTQSPVPPTAPPVQTGVNGNPWGYDFTTGNTIANPPTDFCTYFKCIANFSKGNGYVEECNDTTYSKSGGLSGACSKHGGEMRPLYSH